MQHEVATNHVLYLDGIQFKVCFGPNYLEVSSDELCSSKNMFNFK
jgi:hypothetical protein